MEPIGHKKWMHSGSVPAILISMARYRGFRRRPRTWPLFLGLALFAFGVGVWAWPYWQDQNDVPANSNGTVLVNGNVTGTNNANTAVSTKTNGTNVNVTNANANENTNAALQYDTPISANEKTHGDTSRNEVVFTFDAGAGTQSVQAMLDALKEQNVPGTFFVTGTWAQKNTELLKKIGAAGHEIYNHTMTHPHLTTLSDDEIKQELGQIETIVKNATGASTKPYFRAPYGDRNTHVLSVVAEQGYTSVFWTTDALDWQESSGVTANQVKDRILKNLKPGAIYLMHIGDTLTGNVLGDVIMEIKKQGYAIVRLDRALEE